MEHTRLLVFSDAAEGREDEFNAFYEGTHIPEVLETPGMVAAQRFEALEVDGVGTQPPHKHLTIYELAGDPAAVSQAVAERRASGAITPGTAADPDALVVWTYVPRSGRITG